MTRLGAQILAAALLCAAVPAMANDVFFQSRKTAEVKTGVVLNSSDGLTLTLPAAANPPGGAGASSSLGGSSSGGSKDACEKGEDGVLDQFVQAHALNGEYCSIAKQCVNCCGPEGRFDSYRATCGSVAGNYSSTAKSDTVCEGDGGSNYLEEWLQRARSAGKQNCTTQKTCQNCCGDGSRLDSFFAFCT